MTDSGALAPIGTENDLSAAACLITVFLRELVAPPLPGRAGTNQDFDLDGHHVVLVLEDERGARFPSLALVAVEAGSRAEYGFSSGLEVLNPPLWLTMLSNPIVTCVPTARLMSLFGPIGAM